MIQPLATGTVEPAGSATQPPTLWGLTPLELHDRFWASRGVQIVRRGEDSPLNPHAELYLLTDEHTLTIFRLGKLVDTLSWLRPQMMFVRLHSTLERGYRERVLADEHDRFLGFERIYDDADARMARLGVTPDQKLAQRWQQLGQEEGSWRELRASVRRSRRTAVSIEGHAFDRRFDAEVQQFVRQLVQLWKRPDAVVARVRRFGERVWGDANATPNYQTRCIGPVWVGAGRSMAQVASVVGPAVLWDRPDARPPAEPLEWERIEPTEVLHNTHEGPRLNRVHRFGKRAFDIAFALLGLAGSLPLYPLIMLAIWLEDGRPFFFGHRRETLGGREFACLKFRSMKKNAEQIKAQLIKQNQVDGPQFYIEDDPRLTRVGRLLRDTNLDEVPQLINVLLGHMSIVGPRPSPRSENQYCPPWREARLSVRPGITGLWQVSRSRAEGLDFQEWIRYDIEYVENLTWQLDLWILWRTALKMLRLD